MDMVAASFQQKNYSQKGRKGNKNLPQRARSTQGKEENNQRSAKKRFTAKDAKEIRIYRGGRRERREKRKREKMKREEMDRVVLSSQLFSKGITRKKDAKEIRTYRRGRRARRGKMKRERRRERMKREREEMDR
jgi:hypothetical protein